MPVYYVEVYEAVKVWSDREVNAATDEDARRYGEAMMKKEFGNSFKGVAVSYALGPKKSKRKIGESKLINL